MMVARNILIFLLQNLGFLINIKKSVPQPCQKIECLKVNNGFHENKLISYSGKSICKNKTTLAIPYKISGDTDRDLSADWETALFSDIYTSSPSPLHYRSLQKQ